MIKVINNYLVEACVHAFTRPKGREEKKVKRKVPLKMQAIIIIIINNINI